MGRKNLFFTLLILILVNQLLTGQGEIMSLFPEEGEIPGISAVEPAVTYEGEFLYDHINGGADLYLEYGFIRVLTGKFKDLNNNVLLVEIYEMKDPLAAYGIFSINHSRSSIAARFGDWSVSADDYIVFCKSNYYVNVSWVSRHEEVSDVMQQLALSVTNKIKGPSALTKMLYDMMNVEEAGMVVFIRGNIGLSNLYYFDYRDVFSIENGYYCSFGKDNLVIFEYLDQDAADVFNSVKATLAESRRFSDLEMVYNGFLISDSKGRKLYLCREDNLVLVLIMDEYNQNYQRIVDQFFKKIK